MSNPAPSSSSSSSTNPFISTNWSGHRVAYKYDYSAAAQFTSAHARKAIQIALELYDEQLKAASPDRDWDSAALEIERSKLVIGDICSGAGTIGLEISPFVHRVHCSDYSSGMIDLLKSKITALGISNIDCSVESSEQLFSFPSHSLDIAFLCFGIFLVPDPEGTMNELKRILKPNGILILVNWRDLLYNQMFHMQYQLIECVNTICQPLVDGENKISNPFKGFKYTQRMENEQLLTRHGFTVAALQDHTASSRFFEGVRDFYANTKGCAPAGVFSDSLSPRQQAAVVNGLAQMFGEHARFSVCSTAWIVAGTSKP